MNILLSESNSDNSRALTEAYCEYKKRVENREFEYRVAFSEALKQFRSSSVYRKSDKRASSKAEAQLRAEWACSSNEGYVRILADALSLTPMLYSRRTTERVYNRDANWH